MNPTETNQGPLNPTAEPGTKPHKENTQFEDPSTESRKHRRFRFKSKHRSNRDKVRDSDHHNHRHRHRHRHRRHHHHHESSSSKRHKTAYTTPSTSPPPHQNPQPLSPDTAFRESLFDALGDDEGAMYWESVYGQPIHTYTNPSIPRGPQGELEQMTDEEYAAYVRVRMWERTHEGMMEERERVREEKARVKAERERWERERERERGRFDRAVEESLRRGRERKRGKAWGVVWGEYRRCWEEMGRLVEVGKSKKGEGENGNGNGNEATRLRNVIFWPVETGKRRDVSREAVEEFIRHAPDDGRDVKSRDSRHDLLLAVLKSERVRWHPDKIQHRYGNLGIDDVVMQSATEVFQIIDQMWNEEREKRG